MIKLLMLTLHPRHIPSSTGDGREVCDNTRRRTRLAKLRKELKRFLKSQKRILNCRKSEGNQ